MIYYRVTVSQKAFRAINYTFLFVLACVTFCPFYSVVIRSLSNPVEMVTAYFWPKRFFTFNDWFTGAFYVKDKNLWPLSTFLQIEVLKQGGTGWYGKWSRWATTHPEWEHDPEIQLKFELLRFGSDSLDTAAFVLGILPIVLL